MKKIYEYPDDWGDMGEYLTESDYNNMYDWPAMPDWYNDAVNAGYTGLYEDFINLQKLLCKEI